MFGCTGPGSDVAVPRRVRLALIERLPRNATSWHCKIDDITVYSPGANLKVPTASNMCDFHRFEQQEQTDPCKRDLFESESHHNPLSFALCSASSHTIPGIDQLLNSVLDFGVQHRYLLFHHVSE
jgi:hypothetical protein